MSVLRPRSFLAPLAVLVLAAALALPQRWLRPPRAVARTCGCRPRSRSRTPSVRGHPQPHLGDLRRGNGPLARLLTRPDLPCGHAGPLAQRSRWQLRAGAGQGDLSARRPPGRRPRRGHRQLRQPLERHAHDWGNGRVGRGGPDPGEQLRHHRVLRRRPQAESDHCRLQPEQLPLRHQRAWHGHHDLRRRAPAREARGREVRSWQGGQGQVLQLRDPATRRGRDQGQEGREQVQVQRQGRRQDPQARPLRGPTCRPRT